MRILNLFHLKKRSKPLITESCLRDPTGKWTLRFHQDPDSWSKYPCYFLEKKGPFLTIKEANNLRKPISKTEALKLWRNLRKEGWKKVSLH